MFLRKAAREREPFAVTMIGVRSGERVLQIGIGDRRLAITLASKPGINGQAAIVVADERAAKEANAVAADAGALVDVQVAPADVLPFGDAAFDVAVVQAAAERLSPLTGDTRHATLAEWRRVLRAGGRLVAIEAGTPTGWTALFRKTSSTDPAYEASGGTVAALTTAGFRSVRLLADREGYRFIEGLKT